MTDLRISLPDEEELPPECERCGNEFGGFAVRVGERDVCSVCEQPEYEDHVFDIQQVLNAKHEDEFSAARDDPF